MGAHQFRQFRYDNLINFTTETYLNYSNGVPKSQYATLQTCTLNSENYLKLRGWNRIPKYQISLMTVFAPLVSVRL